MDRDKIKTGIFGAVCGGIAMAVVGFAWGGWVTESKANVMIANASETAVLDRLAPICVLKFQNDPEKAAKTVKFLGTSSWNRGDYVGNQGWATMFGEKDPDSWLARRCAELITQIAGKG